MSAERIIEIKQFANDFNSKIDNAFGIYNTNV